MADSRNRLSVMFKPTTACNLRCKYCYAARGRDDCARSMDMDELRAAFRFLLDYCVENGFGGVHVEWHGGEPTLPGAAFIDEAVDFYESLFGEAGIAVTNGIQTNLARLDDALADLLVRRFPASIGVSVDWSTGERAWPDGRDSTGDVVANLRSLKGAGAKITAISTVSAANVRDPGGMYRFFKDLGVPFRSNRIFPNGTAGSDSSSAGVSAADYASFICALADTMLADPEPHVARTACDYIVAYLRDGSSLCCLSRDCTRSFLSIAPGGAVYPCNRFDTPSEIVGDFRRDKPSDVRARILDFVAGGLGDNPGARRLREEKCPSCPWLQLCHSGCLHSRKTGWIEEECKVNCLIWGHISEALGAMGVPRGFLRGIAASASADSFLDALFGPQNQQDARKTKP